MIETKRAVCIMISFFIVIYLIFALGKWGDMISWFVIPSTVVLGFILEGIYTIMITAFKEIYEGYKNEKNKALHLEKLLLALL